ncbi:helix-turn-helix transcriptional regulator [Dactylosporangium fulvum]|uniref:AraC family transcriptional regulator n=1 Tax=Dactylosporangium fulvum TaxID=53359 RepID=A0ABY5W7G8_9ACTN|nr:AraC family transcriptional regulator [Dactylosporangium fulvum]UWP85305.1 AraC family transcriptional regulator [Dactylosporangium fulvum]
MTVFDDAGPGLLVAVLADIDDFEVNRLARGDDWAADQVSMARKHAESLLPAGARLALVPPDSWIVTLAGDDRGRLMAAAKEYADSLLAAVSAETDVAVTISVSNPHAGPARLETATSEAVRAVERKLVGGGNRLYLFDDHNSAGAAALPERVEGDLARCIREGDASGAVDALRRWIDRVALVEGVTPDVLRRWIGAELLYALDVAGKRRLADGSADWVDAFDRLALDELLEMFEIHERSYLMLWLGQLLPRIVEVQAPQSPGRHVLAMVEQYIRDHYAEDLRLSTVASTVYVSPFYISHLFQRELGTTFLRYLTGVRMHHARQLLAQTKLPVEAIADRVGYCSPKRFRVLFKRTFNVTPTEYRRQYSD